MYSETCNRSTRLPTCQDDRFQRLTFGRLSLLISSSTAFSSCSILSLHLLHYFLCKDVQRQTRSLRTISPKETLQMRRMNPMSLRRCPSLRCTPRPQRTARGRLSQTQTQTQAGSPSRVERPRVGQMEVQGPWSWEGRSRWSLHPRGSRWIWTLAPYPPPGGGRWIRAEG